MKYFLKTKEDQPGQEIFRPEHYRIPSGEEVEIDKPTYDAHNDRDVFESRTESGTKSESTSEESEE